MDITISISGTDSGEIVADLLRTAADRAAEYGPGSLNEYHDSADGALLYATAR